MDFVSFLFHQGDIDKKQLEEIKLSKGKDHRKSIDAIVSKDFYQKKKH